LCCRIMSSCEIVLFCVTCVFFWHFIAELDAERARARVFLDGAGRASGDGRQAATPLLLLFRYVTVLCLGLLGLERFPSTGVAIFTRLDRRRQQLFSVDDQICDRITGGRSCWAGRATFLLLRAANLPRRLTFQNFFCSPKTRFVVIWKRTLVF